MKLSTLISGIAGLVLSSLPTDQLLSEGVVQAKKVLEETILPMADHMEVRSLSVAADVTFAGMDVNYKYDIKLDDAKVDAYWATLTDLVGAMDDAQKKELVEGFINKIPGK